MIPDSPAFREAVFRALCACFGLGPSSAEASRRILRAYADEPPPQPSRDTDVCYYSLSPDPSGFTHEEYRVDHSATEVYTVWPYLLTLVFYGPSAEASALRVRSRLFPDGSGFPRKILRDAGIFPVPFPPLPQLFHESEDGLHRPRADLQIRLKITHTEPFSSIGTITHIPQIIKHG